MGKGGGIEGVEGALGKGEIRDDVDPYDPQFMTLVMMKRSRTETTHRVVETKYLTVH